MVFWLNEIVRIFAVQKTIYSFITNLKTNNIMKGLKLMVCALCAIFLVSSCDLTNKAKGGMIGGAGGGALGALVGLSLIHI